MCAWRTEKIDKDHEDLVFSGMEQGIAPSPHKGTANLQNVNLQTETGEVICSFGRINAQNFYSGSIVVSSSGGGSSTFTITGLISFIPVGTPITVAAGSNLPAGNYYILSVTGTTGSQTVTLSAKFNGAGLTTTAGGGNAAFTTFKVSSPSVGYVIEEYYDGTQLQFRYFILESAGYVWVFDTGATWSTYGWTPINLDEQKTGSTGIGLVNGWIHIFQQDDVWVKMTSALGVDFGNVVDFSFGIPSSGAYNNPHSILTGKDNTMYIANGNYIVTDLPNSSTSAAVANVSSYGSFTFATDIVTVTTLFEGSFPVVGQTITFLTTGTAIVNMNPTTVYYVVAANYNPVLGTFSYSTSVGGSAATPSGGSGTFFFNSYSPRVAATYVLNPNAFTLAPYEIIQCITQANATFFIGTQGADLYTWDGIQPSWNTLIPLPENNIVSLLTVLNNVYAFAGNKGNIYITSGAAASLALSVPDYCAGIVNPAQTGFGPASFIEPYFIWGGTAYIRGRIYFSIQDQTAAKAGNCGGIWSFIPTEGLYIGQDTGLSLRMENTNSYGNLNGVANVIIPNQNQAAIGTQYFTGWSSGAGSPTFGIDASGTFPNITAIIETDVLNTGTMLNKKSFAQQEYKLSSPLLSGESVQLYYRLNLTDAWTSCGAVVAESNSLSGYFTSAFQNTQWLQLQAQLIPNGTSTFSGNRMTEIRLR